MAASSGSRSASAPESRDATARTAAELVRPGGRLVYATCSLLPEEDEDQVAAFLGRHPDFAPLPLAEAWAATGLDGPPPAGGEYLLTSPARHGTDGFFAAVLQRRA
jgi:16S rRNA (cytosine967-C5)-methyltransferase